MKKRVVSFLLVLVLCFSVNSIAFANEASNVNHENGTMSITVMDENGNDKQYIITEDSIVTIPIYGVKEGEIGARSRNQLAELNIRIQGGRAHFTFTPYTIDIALLAIGFTGSMTTYSSGIRYGHNNFKIPTSGGSVEAPQSGTGSLSGTYSVLGYEKVDILDAFSW